MTASVHPSMFTFSYFPINFDHYPYDHGDAPAENFMTRADPEFNEAEGYANPIMGVQHMLSDSAAGDAPTRTPSFSATPMTFGMPARPADQVSGRPHIADRGVASAHNQNMSVAAPQVYQHRVSECENLEGFSSESPEGIWTPASSLPGPPSLNEDAAENQGEDAYSNLSEWSPCLPTLTADSNTSRQRSPLGHHNAIASSHVTDTPSRSAAHSGVFRNSAHGHDGHPSLTDLSYPTSTSTPSGSDDWMANQEDYDSYPDESYVAEPCGNEPHGSATNIPLPGSTFAPTGYANYGQVPSPVYPGLYGSFPAHSYSTPLPPQLHSYNMGQYNLPAHVDPYASFMHYAGPSYAQNQVPLQHDRLQPHRIAPQQLPSVQDGPMISASHRDRQIPSQQRPTQHQQRSQQSTTMRNAPRQPTQPSMESTTTPAQTTSRASRMMPSGRNVRFVPPPAEPPRPKAPERITPIKEQSNSPQSTHSSTVTPGSARPLQVLVKAEPGQASNDPRRQAHAKSRRGGREKNSKLPDVKKVKISQMRHDGACWKCVFQRDSCDRGHPCSRCSSRDQRGAAYFFPCNRTKLPELLPEFLPPTMTLVHARQTIEDTVHKEVRGWSEKHPIDVYLTSGYGPALRWTVYEFKPNSDELLTQLQYFHNPATGLSEGRYKYSPPFGLMKLDENDDAHVQDYLDRLMDAQYLDDLGWTCFEDEGHADSSAFQCNLLNFMCTLYLGTEDEDLRDVLQSIIRMMIITYIMAHTLTITEDTLPTVLSSVRMSAPPAQITRHTSPRLANRQLKFFFAFLRQKIYDRILKWQQQTLHGSTQRESTWLTSFCAMLGFAMVLEEVQRALQIQADAKAKKGEMLADDARVEACNACKRIDERYDLLVMLFQGKYLHKKLGNGSFGPGSPHYPRHAEHQFLTRLKELVVEKGKSIFLRGR